jgi:hypothetical protein
VKVRYGEGLAIRIGPKPCAGTCEGDSEASAGERMSRGAPGDGRRLKVRIHYGEGRSVSAKPSVTSCTDGRCFSEIRQLPDLGLNVGLPRI